MSYWIVVVDDEAMSLTNAKKLLDGQDMRVSCLRSGRDLLKFMEKNAPDLVLLDIMMPEMDGFATYHALRQFEEESGRQQVPVIFLTGADDSETERRGLKAGASDFIRKPFNKEILVRRIHNAVANTKRIESLTEEAMIDKLTGFLNKTAGMERIAKFCSSQIGALMVLDLDNFKLVNDLYGHDMGDRVLKAFADVVRHNTRSGDIVSRIGGDEFMAFFCNIEKGEAVASLTERLNGQFVGEAAKLMGESFDLPLGISIGAVMVPEHGRSYDMLFSFADHALYVAKQNGKHGCALYRDETEPELPREENLRKELSRITRIIEERNEKKGALLLGMEPFSYIYRFLKRFDMRYGGKSVKLLFVLSEEYPKDAGELCGAAAKFRDHLEKQLRRSDIILQNKPNQFFLLLPELSEEDGPKFIERILSEWEKTEHPVGIRIEYAIEYAVYEAPAKSRPTKQDEGIGSL